MRIGVVSDTHGHKDNLKKVFELLVEKNIDVFCHLGDDYDDMRIIKAPENIKIVQVPGVFSDYYKDPKIPNRITEVWNGKRFLLTHTRTVHKNDLEGDPDPEALVKEGKIDVMLFGHTHIPAIIMEGKTLLFNPGHLKDEDKKGFSPTYGILEVEKNTVLAQIFELFSGKVIYQGKMAF